ncbi:hypothetical protein CHCC20487_2550 [Bacillus licheniformis]|nr:hypothetical protein CHCC20487_2550 [Bacillus licheniformis]
MVLLDQLLPLFLLHPADPLDPVDLLGRLLLWFRSLPLGLLGRLLLSLLSLLLPRLLPSGRWLLADLLRLSLLLDPLLLLGRLLPLLLSLRLNPLLPSGLLDPLGLSLPSDL